MTTMAEIYLNIPAHIVKDRNGDGMIAAKTGDILLALERARKVGQMEGVDIAQRIDQGMPASAIPILQPVEAIARHTAAGFDRIFRS